MEYRIIERHFYDRENKRILIDKVNKKNYNVHYYKIIENKKTTKITSEYFHNELAKSETTTPKYIERKIASEMETLKLIKKEQDEYDEYEYMITFDYETPTVTIGGKQTMKHGKHDFKTEYRITSPVKLSDNEVKKVIQAKYSDYFNVLKNEESYDIVEEINKINERPKLEVKQTTKITR